MDALAFQTIPVIHSTDIKHPCLTWKQSVGVLYDTCANKLQFCECTISIPYIQVAFNLLIHVCIFSSLCKS